MQEYLNKILEEKPLKIILSNPTKKDNPFKRININKVTIKYKDFYQLEKYTDTQVFHENIEYRQLGKVINDYLDCFKQLNAFSNDKQMEIKISKKGKVFYNEKISKNEIETSHNRKKQYLLPQNMVIAPLVDLGVINSDGKIINSHYDKYKQINRFLEYIEDVIKDYKCDELKILDFGCGKSYLTFILYFYLTEIKKIKTNIIGLDLKKDVIEHCNKIAEKYKYENLHFEVGDIANYKYTDNLDMVITLHACDTATDYALFNAIKWHANIILSVPCCQHELNKQIISDDYAILTRYGLIKERISALFTDAIRANILEIMGYKTQVIEFIDMSHSPKNILLRATKNKNPSPTKIKKAQDEIDKLINEYHLDPTLLKLLKENGLYK